MTIRLASVFFPGERKNYVVPVSDILDLKPPKGIDDFDKDRLYKVRWDVLRRENSDTTESQFEGKIQLLAATPESLISQAAKANPVIKLPPAFTSLHSKNVRESKRAREARVKTVEAVDMAKEASKKAKKQVYAALERSCQERMREIRTQYQTITDRPVAAHAQQDKEVKQNVCEQKQPTDEALDQSGAQSKANGGEETLDDEANVDNIKAASSKSHEVEGSDGVTAPRRLLRKRKRVKATEYSESDESLKSMSSSEKKGMFHQEQIIKLKADLVIARKQARKAETEAISLRLRLENWEKAYRLFNSTISSNCLSPAPPKFGRRDTTPEYSPTRLAKLAPPKFGRRDTTPEYSPTRLNNWVDSTVKFSGGKNLVGQEDSQDTDFTVGARRVLDFISPKKGARGEHPVCNKSPAQKNLKSPSSVKITGESQHPKSSAFLVTDLGGQLNNNLQVRTGGSFVISDLPGSLSASILYLYR